MLNNTKYSFADSLQKFQIESLRSKHRVMVTYLQFLYKRHPDLELNILIEIFTNREGLYKQFIENTYSEILAEPYCDKITSLLIESGYPTSFLDFKEREQKHLPND